MMKSNQRVARLSVPLIGAMLLGTLAAPANATTIQMFADLATWQAAAGGKPTETTSYGDPAVDPAVTSVDLIGGLTLSGAPGDPLFATSISDWGAWCCGYTGQVLARFGSDSYTFTLSGPVNGLGMFIEPGKIAPFSIALTLSDGSSQTQTVDGNGPAQFFGWVGLGITSFTITVDDITQDDPQAGGFAIGDIFSSNLAPVPGPIAGSGLPALIALASGGLLSWRRRKRMDRARG